MQPEAKTHREGLRLGTRILLTFVVALMMACCLTGQCYGVTFTSLEDAKEYHALQYLKGESVSSFKIVIKPKTSAATQSTAKATDGNSTTSDDADADSDGPDASIDAENGVATKDTDCSADTGSDASTSSGTDAADTDGSTDTESSDSANEPVATSITGSESISSSGSSSTKIQVSAATAAKANEMKTYLKYHFDWQATKMDNDGDQFGVIIWNYVAKDKYSPSVTITENADGSITITYKQKLAYLHGQSQQKKFYKRAKSLLKNLKVRGHSDRAKAKIIFRWMYKNIKYDYSYKNYTPQDALLKKKSVCQGYAELYSYLLRMSGVKATVVESSDHAWTLVKIGKKWYHNDVTWAACVKSPKKYWMKSSKFTKLKHHKMEKKFRTSTFKKKHPVSSKSLSW